MKHTCKNQAIHHSFHHEFQNESKSCTKAIAMITFYQHFWASVSTLRAINIARWKPRRDALVIDILEDVLYVWIILMAIGRWAISGVMSCGNCSALS